MEKRGAMPSTKPGHPEEPGWTILICHACSSGLKQPQAYLNYLPDSWQLRKHKQYQLRDLPAGNTFHIPPSRTGLQGHPFTTNWILIYLHFFLPFPQRPAERHQVPWDMTPGLALWLCLPHNEVCCFPMLKMTKNLQFSFCHFLLFFPPKFWPYFPAMFSALKTS